MKNAILILTLLTTFVSQAQDFSSLKPEFLVNETHFKAAEPDVLKCANFLLDTPLHVDEQNRANAFLYLFKWMEGTPHYTFSLDEEVTKLTKGNDDLLMMYFTALAKIVLDDQNNELNKYEINHQAAQLLVNYCSDKTNGLKPSREIKKRIKAQK